jgi:hypothetical protein
LLKTLDRSGDENASRDLAEEKFGARGEGEEMVSGCKK